MAANLENTPSSSDEEFEMVRSHSYPYMTGLLQTLLTEIPSLVQNAQRELNEALKIANVAEEEKLKKNLKEALKQNEELEKMLVQKERHQDVDLKALQGKVAKLENRLSHEERSKSEIENKMKKEMNDSQQTIDNLQRKLQLAENEARTMKDELKKRKGLDNSFKKERESYDNLERQFKKIKEELKNTNAELEETKTRLSKAMGDKLTDNNPNIADLSDRNRPTKLAERYQEIYDNEWTDAFETLDEIYNNEEKTTSILIHILMETRDFCGREADYQMGQIQKAIIQNESSPQRKMPANLLKQLKDCRKTIAETSGKYIFQKYNKELQSSKSSIARRACRVPEFVAACFNTCWLMAVQDPPIVFGPNVNHGDHFNTDLYKAFTKSGKKVDFMVWPALHLHTNGPVLCKGVAQGYAEVPRRSRSAPGKDRRQNQSSETTPEDKTPRKINTKLKTRDITAGIRTDSRKLYGYGEDFETSSRRAGNSQRSTPVTRQSRTVYKPKNLIQCDNTSPPDQKPSDGDVDTFLRWRDMFGPKEARRLMGEDYDKCLKYLRGLGII